MLCEVENGSCLVMPTRTRRHSFYDTFPPPPGRRTFDKTPVGLATMVVRHIETPPGVARAATAIEVPPGKEVMKRKERDRPMCR